MIALLKSDLEIEAFKKAYEALSGLAVPIEYLKESQVYGSKIKGQMVGGYVLSGKVDLRTIKVFTNLESGERTSRIMKELGNHCEVCCFWMNYKYRRKFWFNGLLWIKMAWDVKNRTEKMILFGTNSKGLAKVYGFPKNSILIITDEVNEKRTFIFSAKRKHFFYGVWSIVKARIFGSEKFETALIPKYNLQASIKKESNENIVCGIQPKI